MTPTIAGWFVELDVAPEAVPVFSDVFDDLAITVGSAEITEHVLWRIEAFFREEPDLAALSVAIELTAAAADLPVPALRLREEPVADWVAETYRRFPPFRVGRFFIHGGHWQGKPPAGSVPLKIEAAVAFGSGEHGSTSGCLLALDRLGRRRGRPRVLDLGCGSGILAIAAAKLWGIKVMASDSDPVAVRTARENAVINGIGRRLTGVVSRGFASARLSGPYDLVLANILARPLTRLARPMAPRLARGGRTVLSGLLKEQVPLVLQAYRAQGLALERRIVRGDWATLVVRKRKTAAE